MRPITFMFVVLPLLTTPVFADNASDDENVRDVRPPAPMISDKCPIDPQNCEDQLGNKGPRHCRAAPFQYFSDQVKQRHGDKKLQNSPR